MYRNIKVIAFDADDTLWVNEPYFRETEGKFATLLSGFETKNKIDQELFKKEIANLDLYGYGIKGFVLSMIECALELSNYTLSGKDIEKIIDFGKRMLNHPIELLDDVELVLKSLSSKYRLILATKGDLVDQERKLEKSKLGKYFHHIEVMSEKKTEDYQNILSNLGIKSSEFLMVGNSLKSDILPLIKIGASAIHVPYHTTWVHEEVTKEEQDNATYRTVSTLKDILPHL
ncbi:MAG: HAD hydrolase-like protein [Flavobacteriaceae bacterium]|nr:HAD hydrolase-like protein [Flavobacteriaceae bacterium]